jgi:DNA-binding response OmpR family regulator
MNEYESVRRREIHTPQKTYELQDVAIPKMAETRSILLLEDDNQLANLLKDGLENQGYMVTVVGNGAEGLKKIMIADFSVIVCDMVMPNFPGDMFYLAVERIRPHLCKRFIFITGHRGDRKIEQFIRSIRGLMLWKPFDMHVLLDAINVVINKSRDESAT